MLKKKAKDAREQGDRQEVGMKLCKITIKKLLSGIKES